MHVCPRARRDTCSNPLRRAYTCSAPQWYTHSCTEGRTRLHLEGHTSSDPQAIHMCWDPVKSVTVCTHR